MGGLLQTFTLAPYLLFIDTEASGLPKKWNLPYSEENNWPHAVQISWIIYTKEGIEIKEENHYIKGDFKISHSARRVHGISDQFLETNGESRESVLGILAKDIEQYNPLIIGHFLELDLHVLGADFYRSKLNNPIKDARHFCTMIATKHLARHPGTTNLRLGELYATLFEKKPEHQHNAIADARATADCFFELCKRGEITEEKILKQQERCKEKTFEKPSILLPVFLIVVLIILIITLFIL